MKLLLKLEELAMLLLSIFLLWNSDAPWFWYLLLLLGPDISMLGYLINNKVGAFLYNFFHHKGIAIIIFLTGIYLSNGLAQQIGVVLFGHASFDRIAGYGLKYEKGFGFTHLGEIGKGKGK
ncbi:DUF4260 domain-containing protein [Niabella ginsengisoli]|uniref:DUF4260 domain-containing protein n=1 Tax=Niabella ginsengisoli TaxID=522298 RepID=A0ABS9SM55_9BACT|nr:DUF4260 domain-containing protein [Niabella ginsengisoli]MCH5599460.1 DUF4260 domain-containing protein [Niabella ginsengisoli]